jgi:hypothetical protein
METPLQIDLQGIDARPDIRAEIDKHVAQLEERSGRITAGRVVVKAPSGHQRTGGLYEITIHLSLPEGREVISAAPRKTTSVMRTSTTLSTMPSSARADSCRMRYARCRAK